MQRVVALLTLTVYSSVWAVPQPLGGTDAAAENAAASFEAQKARSVEELLAQAKFLIGKYRPDLARLVLQKALAVEPDQPRVLLMLGDLELRTGRNAEAQEALQALQTRYPDIRETREMQSLWRLYTVDRLRLLQLRQLQTRQRGPEATMLARQLFPDGVLPGSLAEEFGDLLSVRAVAGGGRRGGSPDPVVQARLRGYVALGERRQEAAEAEFRRALKMRPTDASSLGGLGIVRLRDSRYADARRLFESAIVHEKEDASEWRALAATATYWDEVGRARLLMADSKWDQAEPLLLHALPLQPQQAEARVLLAEVYVAQQRTSDAERLYADALALSPSDTRALRGRATLRLATASSPAELDAALDDTSATAQRLHLPLAELIDTGVLRDAADRQVAEGRPGVAVRLLERGVAAVPADPWLRHDLARLYLRQGMAPLAQQVMAEGVALAPQDSTMRYAAALIALSDDRESDALKQLDTIPAAERTEAHRTLAQSARFELAMRRSRQALATGDAAALDQALAAAWADTAELPDRRLRVARAELGAGHTARARAELAAIDPRTLAPAEVLSWAELAIDTGREADAEALLAAMVAPSRGGPLQDRVIDAQARLAQRRIEQALQQGDTALARRWAAQGLAAWTGSEPVPVRARLAQAELWLAAGEPAEALAWLDTQLRADQQDLNARLLRIRALAATGQPRTARADMDRLVAERPGDAEVRLEAARLARRMGDYNGAMAHLRAVANAPAPVAPPSAGNVAAVTPVLAPGMNQPTGNVTGAGQPAAASRNPAVQAAIDEIEARRQPRVEVAYTSYSRSGSPGISELHAKEIPVVVTWPWGYNGHVFGRLDLVELNPGNLPTPLAAANNFGSVYYANNAAPPITLPQLPPDQRARGSNVGVGWEDDVRRVDVGLTGLGMPVRNVVGGWRESFDQPWLDITMDLSRRPETRSRLTYAGAHDPVTGAIWGGVVNTSAAARVARALPAPYNAYNVSSSLRLGVLDGEHVQSNRYGLWRSVIDRDWYVRDDFRFNAGLAAMFWRFAHNSSDATYGQGGYYSPQRYFSLSLPLEIVGRRGPLSYQLRGALTHSWTYVEDAPYYPLDPVLQAAAGNPVHGGGSGGGFGTSWRGTLEWRLTPQWVAGAGFDIERSSDYAPNRAVVYLRHFFKPQAEALSVPPRPVIPYSQF